jgi:hypothetical protein
MRNMPGQWAIGDLSVKGVSSYYLVSFQMESVPMRENSKNHRIVHVNITAIHSS